MHLVVAIRVSWTCNARSALARGWLTAESDVAAERSRNARGGRRVVAPTEFMSCHDEHLPFESAYASDGNTRCPEWDTEHGAVLSENSAETEAAAIASRLG